MSPGPGTGWLPPGDPPPFHAAPFHAEFHGVEFTVFLALFVLVTVIGFGAARWRRADSLDHLDEWGLGGRGFGSFVAWFLIGGDIFTAYTFIAVPGAMYATGAVSGWFAVVFTSVVWPIVFVIMPRLWVVASRNGYVTPADFVRGRYGSRALALAVAVTGIVATMPYIALQLVGMQAVLEAMGIGSGGDNPIVRDIPIVIAFTVLAAYTYRSGLRAPALIAFVKDVLIYAVVLVAVIYIPHRLGGYGAVFDAAQAKFDTANAAAAAAGRPPKAAFIPGPSDFLAYATLALGSAMALFMYPHAITGILSTRSQDVIRRNTVALPLYSLLLAFLALLGFAAIASGVKTDNPRLVVPLLFDQQFPAWFTGVAFAAVAIGALVPAAIMSIAAANLFTRNIYVEFFRPDATPAQETSVSRTASLLVKVGALVFVLGMDTQNSINLQLLGGVWILQTFPAIVAGLWTRWLHRWALLGGWLAGMAYGTFEAHAQRGATARHFGSSLAEVPGLGRTAYIALTAFVLNVVIAVALTGLLRALRVPAGADTTQVGADATRAVGAPVPADGGAGVPAQPPAQVPARETAGPPA
ncbi:monocarboxylate uptake permease MctP [Parafrankia discariae]|uniref:monocarboxylate uptake permease MctP n=1 Tax=Parafrankia discariae TaxID=365528 RepID=UPI00037AAA68|nr:sodium:solute symporter [Parafrankia discariae]